MNKQWEKLRVWYAGLQQREQRVVAIGGVVVAVLILVLGILLPLQSAVSSAVKRNQVEREDLAWMQVNAPEIRAAGNQLPADTGEAPVVLVDVECHCGRIHRPRRGARKRLSADA